jgi:hypothetical protein
MSKYSKWFVLSGLFFLTVGGCFGVLMALRPDWIVYIKFSHIHVMMIGWISMMIFGLGYHVIPRFSASKLIDDKWQMIHWWFANIALIGMISIPLFKYVQSLITIRWDLLFLLFGFLQFMGIVIFVVNMLLALKIISSPSMQLKACCSADKCN